VEDKIDELKRRLVVASNIRGGICVQKSTERKCGYIIRPELKFKRILNKVPGMVQFLEENHIPARNVYSQFDEINLLLDLIEGFEEASDTPYGIEMVRRSNGILLQPRTHDEVIDALNLIENISKSMTL